MPSSESVVRRDHEVDAGVEVEGDLRVDDVRLVPREERHDELHARASVGASETRQRRAARRRARPGAEYSAAAGTASDSAEDTSSAAAGEHERRRDAARTPNRNGDEPEHEPEHRPGEPARRPVEPAAELGAAAAVGELARRARRRAGSCGRGAQRRSGSSATISCSVGDDHTSRKRPSGVEMNAETLADGIGWPSLGSGSWRRPRQAVQRRGGRRSPAAGGTRATRAGARSRGRRRARRRQGAREPLPGRRARGARSRRPSPTCGRRGRSGPRACARCREPKNVSRSIPYERYGSRGSRSSATASGELARRVAVARARRSCRRRTPGRAGARGLRREPP